MATLWTLVSVILVLWTLTFLFFHRYLSRRTSTDRILSELRDEVDRMVREIDAITDRDVALVEERVNALRAMLDEMDKRILAYRRETDRQSVQERTYAELGRTVPRVRSPESYGNADATREKPPERPYVAASTPVIEKVPISESVKQPELADVASAAPTVPAETEEPVPLPRIQRSAVRIQPKSAPFAERVAELYRAGFSADLIASKLKASVAEVDLAVELLRRLDNHGQDTGN